MSMFQDIQLHYVDQSVKNIFKNDSSYFSCNYWFSLRFSAFCEITPVKEESQSVNFFLHDYILLSWTRLEFLGARLNKKFPPQTLVKSFHTSQWPKVSKGLLCLKLNYLWFSVLCGWSKQKFTAELAILSPVSVDFWKKKPIFCSFWVTYKKKLPNNIWKMALQQMRVKHSRCRFGESTWFPTLWKKKSKKFKAKVFFSYSETPHKHLSVFRNKLRCDVCSDFYPLNQCFFATFSTSDGFFKISKLSDKDLFSHKNISGCLPYIFYFVYKIILLENQSNDSNQKNYHMNRKSSQTKNPL